MSQEHKSSAVLQYEALHYIWSMARHHEDLETFRDHIKELLSSIASDGDIDFEEALKKLREVRAE